MRRSKRIRISKAGREEAESLEYFAATHLHHVGNKVEWYGRPFYLEDFQRRNIWMPVFGTGRMVGGSFRRRYRSALIGMPRDFGKTELVCAMLLSEANMHPVNKGQYGVVAYSKDQAKKILDTLKTMIALDAELSSIWIPLNYEITNKETGAVIKVFPYSEGAVQSWHFNMLICDELHVWKDERVWNALISGMGAVNNSLVVAITTASSSRSGFLWDWLNGTDEIVSVFDDSEAYCWWHGAPDDADIDDRATWKKIILPSWITLDDMERNRRRQTRHNFERYALNRFPIKKRQYSCFTDRQLNRCMKAENDWDWCRPFALGIDGATSGDSFAIVGYQAFSDDDGEKHHNVREWVFDEPDSITGHYPLNDIMELIAGIYQQYWPAVVGIDPNRMIVLSNQLKDVYGVETVSFTQNNATMCQAASLVMNLVKSGALRLAGCPKTRQHLANTVEDDKGSYGIRFGKDESGSKIDAAIALAIAVLGFDKLVGESGGAWSTFNG